MLPSDDFQSSQPSQSISLDSRIKTGLRWTLARQAVVAVTSTLAVIVYSRLLNPSDIGAVTLAFIVYNGLFLLVQTPIRDAVVYFQGEEASYGSAAFWLLFIFSAVAVLLVMVFAYPIERFYRSPDTASLIRGMATAFLFQALAVVPASLLIKRFRYRIHETLQAITAVILSIGWILLSVLHFGTWSLVWPQILSAAFWALSTWIAARFRPILHPITSAYKDIIQYSRNLVGSKLIIYLTGNLDNAAVGLLGKTMLGWYSFGENQSFYLASGVAATVAQIALPAMAEAQDETASLRQIYLNMLRLVATFSIPVQIGAIVLADLGIFSLFGSQWIGAVDIFRAFLFFRLLQALLAVTDAAVSASGHPEIRFQYDLFRLPLFAIGIALGLLVLENIYGIAWTLAFINTITGLFYFRRAMKITNLSTDTVLRFILPSLSAGSLMGLILFIIRIANLFPFFSANSLPSLSSAIYQMVVLGLGAVLFYFGVLYLIDPSGTKSVLNETLRIVLPRLTQPVTFPISFTRKPKKPTG